MVSKKAAKRLKTLANFIRKLPAETFDMDVWGIKRHEYNFKICETDLKKAVSAAKKDHLCGTEDHLCGTACCIGGWAIIREKLCLDDNGEVYNSKRSKKSLGQASDVAQKILDLTDGQANALFYPSRWPGRFRNYPENPTPVQAADRIEFLIEKGF